MKTDLNFTLKICARFALCLGEALCDRPGAIVHPSNLLVCCTYLLRSLTPISRFVAVGLLPEQPDGPQSPFPVAKLEAQYREKRWQFS